MKDTFNWGGVGWGWTVRWSGMGLDCCKYKLSFHLRGWVHSFLTKVNCFQDILVGRVFDERSGFVTKER